jgi:hypothetical protein
MFSNTSSSSSATQASANSEDIVLQQYAEGVEKGRAAIKKYLVKMDQSYVQKWSILIKIFQKIGEEECRKVCSFFGKIPPSQKLLAYAMLQQSLVNFMLSAQAIETLIPLLIANKLLSQTDLSYLYNALAAKSDEENREEDTLAFYQKALEQPNQILSYSQMLCLKEIFTRRRLLHSLI